MADQVTTLHVYLAGPMRGYPRYNFDEFFRARTVLRQWHIVRCPAERDELGGFDPDGPLDGFNLPGALHQCFLDVLDTDGVVLLDGWEKSEGARAEALVAQLTGKRLWRYDPDAPQGIVELVDADLRTRVAF